MTLARRHLIVLTASAVSFSALPRIARAACSPARTPMMWINGPPEYIPGAPVRGSFRDDADHGQKIKLYGRALQSDCSALGNARLDFWHADHNGKYDASGYTFRGAQITDRDGTFALETRMPGPYEGPRHIHFLLATRLNDQPQPVFLSSAVFLPTTEEYAAMAPATRTAEFIAPDTLHTVADVLMVPCDFIMEHTPATERA